MACSLRRVSLPLALLAALALAGPAEAATAVDAKKRKRAPTCKRKRSKTLQQSRSVRVFEKAAGAERTRLYGCLKRRGKSIRLAEAYDDGYVTSTSYQEVRLAGRFVAWEDTSTDISCKADCPPGYNPDTTSIEVYDLARRQRRSFSGTVLNESLVLTRRGSVAWLQRTSPATAVEVHIAEGSTTRVLDRGNVDPDSLRVNGGTLFWMKDGAQQSSPIR